MQTTVRTGLDAGANAGVEIVELKVRDQSFDYSGCHFSCGLILCCLQGTGER